MKQLTILLALILSGLHLACSQNNRSANTDKKLNQGCEGCEAVYEYGGRQLNSVDTLVDFLADGPKMLVTGTILKNDGKTPAPGVVLYIYHTNSAGIYPTKGNEKGWGKRHGFLRGWIKTGADGKYAFYTQRPGAYPGRENPEHIHAILKEPGYEEYWIDEFLFEDDPILPQKERDRRNAPGGSGLVKPIADKNGLLVAKRDIILGLNIKNYE